MSMTNYFKDLLTEGKLPIDPFEDATERVLKKKELSEEEKATARQEWNRRIAEYCRGDTEKLLRRVLWNRAYRVVHRS